MMRSGLIVCAALALFVMSGCGDNSNKSPQANATPGPSASPTPETTSTLLPTPTPRIAPQPTPSPDKLVIDYATTAPWSPTKGQISAYRVTDSKQLVAGQFATGFFGDAVLENDLVKIIINRPQSDFPLSQSGGQVVDVINTASRIDYLNYIQAMPDVESSSTQIVYDKMSDPTVEGATTASVTFTGYVGERRGDETSTAPLSRMEGLNVATTYTLASDDHLLAMETEIRNDSPRDVELLPGDAIDWGGAGTFVSGTGFVNGLATVTAPWVSASMDETSLLYASADSRPVAGKFTNQLGIVRGYGEGEIQLPTKATPAPERLEEEKFGPVRFRSAPGSEAGSPGIRVDAPVPSPSSGPTSDAPSLPRTETNFNPSSETNFNLRGIQPSLRRETELSPTSTQPRVDAWREVQEAPGGGGVRGSDTPTLGSDGARRLTLKPGDSYTFRRVLIVSDKNMARASERLAKLKGSPLGYVSGAVLERDTNAPLANAEVRISGSMASNPTGAPGPIIRAMTRPDGTFVVGVQPGTYFVNPADFGRVQTGGPGPVQIKEGSRDAVMALTMSPPSLLRVAVVDGDAPTTSPLPGKITILSKPGTPIVEFGSTLELGAGFAVRNTVYLPNGAGAIPLLPGRYEVVVSRGTEYSISRHNVDIRPESIHTVVSVLKQELRPTGLMSVDAGVQSVASSTSRNSRKMLAAMAACEGVQLLISGDDGVATDLQSTIDSVGLGRYVRAFTGMRFLVGGDEQAADILVYPVEPTDVAALQSHYEKNRTVPPDVFLADLRSKFPKLIAQVDRGLDPQFGYFSKIDYDENARNFVGGVMPPPDFEAMQLLDGRRYDLQPSLMARYQSMLVDRTNRPGGAAPLAPVASSYSRLAFGQEVGSGKTYFTTRNDTLAAITPADLVKAYRGQHVIGTNGPLATLTARDERTGKYDKVPGDVTDLQSTDTLSMNVFVRAASWISVSGINLSSNAKDIRKIEVRDVESTTKYPVRQGPDAAEQNQQLLGDAIVGVMAYSSRRPMTPVIMPNPPSLGGEVFPVSWSGPLYVDQNSDGKVTVNPND